MAKFAVAVLASLGVQTAESARTVSNIATVKTEGADVELVQESRSGTCQAAYKVLADARIHFYDPEFGTTDPFRAWSEPVKSQKRTCRLKMFGSKVRAGCDGVSKAFSDCKSEIEADMKVQCPQREVNEAGINYDCRPFIPRSKMFGSGYNIFAPLPHYQAMCACRLASKGIEDGDADTPDCKDISQKLGMAEDVTPMCDEMDSVVHRGEDYRCRTEFSQASCNLAAFAFRRTKLEAYKKLEEDAKKKAQQEHLDAAAAMVPGIDDFGATILLFELADNLRTYKRDREKGKGYFASLTIREISEMSHDKIVDYFVKLASTDEDFCQDREVMKFYAKLVSPILAKLSDDEDSIKAVKKEIDKLEEDLRKGISSTVLVSQPEEARMTKELCIKAMAAYGCPADLVNFKEAKEPSGESVGVESDTCACEHVA